MGKPKFSGAGMVDAQNSFADTTFSRNRYGTYFKAKPPTPAGSIWLAFWQVNVAACEAIWQSISDADRASWSYYKIHRKNQMAGAKVLTGHESFMAVNLNRIICSTTPVATPPPYSPVSQISAFSFATAFPGTVQFDVDLYDWSTSNVAIYCTNQLPAGRMSVNQIYALLFVTSFTGSIDITTEYNARFGALVSGKKIFIKFVPINIFTGARGVARYLSSIN